MIDLAAIASLGVRVLPWLPTFVAALVTVRISPYFGNMDDSRFVDLAGASNPFVYAADFFNPGSGFIRSGSLIIVWPAAWLGYHLGADAYFLTNVLVVTACLAAFGFAYGRIARWGNEWLFVGFMGAAFAWPYTAEMLFFPSLSEKGIILGGAALLACIWTLYNVINPWLKAPLLVTLSLFAFSTKTQILLLVPGAIALLWTTRNNLHPEPDRIPRWGLTTLWVLLSIVVLYLARTGWYTSPTQGEVGTGFISDRRFQLLFVIAVGYVCMMLWRLAKGKFEPTDLVPIVYLSTAVAAFPIWEIRNYYLATASVAVAVAVVTVLTWWKANVITAVAVMMVLVASIWLTYRLPQVYESLASVRQFLTSDVARQLSADQAKILVSCSEAPDHYNPYARQLGVSGIEFAFPAGGTATATFQDLYIFADSRLCPWPATVPREGWSPVWTSPFGNDTFQLFFR